MKEIVYDHEAKCDIIGAARFYEAQVTGLGARFIKAVDTTIIKIAANPEIHAFCSILYEKLPHQWFSISRSFCSRTRTGGHSGRVAYGPAIRLVGI